MCPQPFGRTQHVGHMSHTSLGLHLGLDILVPIESAFQPWKLFPMQTTLPLPRCLSLILIAAELVGPVGTPVIES